MLIALTKKNFKRYHKRLTDYNKRYRLLKSENNRLVIRFTNRMIIMQLVEYFQKGDIVLKTWLSKSITNVPKYNKNYETLLKLFEIVNEYLTSNQIKCIIDSGLKNNSTKLKKLYQHVDSKN